MTFQGTRAGRDGLDARLADREPFIGWLHRLFVGALLVLAVLVIYGQTLGFEFVDFDDGCYVTDNSRVQSGLSLNNVRWAFTTTAVANWHPMTWISHMTDVTLFGLDAGLHHLTSVMLHAANSLALFLVLFRFTQDIRRSAFVAAVFALHPLHVESVAWISERKDVLSAFFWLMTMAVYRRYVRSPAGWRMAGVALVFALSLMAKPMAVTLPLILILMDRWPFLRFNDSGELTAKAPNLDGLIGRMAEKWPLFALAGMAGVMTLVAQYNGGAVATLSRFSMAERVGNMFYAYGQYLWRTLFPFKLAAFYPHPGSVGWGQPLAGGLVMAAITVWTYRQRKPYPAVWTGWLWFCITLLPVIGLVQVGSQAFADRYMYLPMIGLMIAAAWFPYERFFPAMANPGVRLLAAAVFLITIGVLSVPQIATWQTSRIMASQAISVTTGNYKMHTVLANALAREGQFERALMHYDTAIRIKPDFEVAHYHKGRLFMQMGTPAKAVERFKTAISFDPTYADAYVQLGGALAAMGHNDQAMAALRTALDHQPELPNAHNNLGALLNAVGRVDEAIAHFRNALRMAPTFAEAHSNLGEALARSGRYGEAMDHYRKALRYQPGLEGVHYNVGNLLQAVGRLDEAIVMYRHHLSQNPVDAACYNNMGIAWIKQGYLDPAARAFAAASQLQPLTAEYRQNYHRVLKQRSRQVP